MDPSDTDYRMNVSYSEPTAAPLNILHLDCTTGYGGQERDHIAEAKGMNSRGHRYVIGGTNFPSSVFKIAKPLSNVFPEASVALKALRSPD